MSKKVKFFIFVFGLLGLFLVANFVFGNLVLAQDFGTNEVANGLNNSLKSADPRFIIGRIIQIILGFLGVIALVLIMYAGFLWMSSEGDEDKIGQAKRILRNAVIGLAIILSAWAIATFVLARLAGVMGPGSEGYNSSSGFSDQGIGAIGACTVDSFYPTSGQRDVPRNSSIIITFKEQLKLDSICRNSQNDPCACGATCNRINPEAIRLYKTDLGDACSSGSCPNPNLNVADIQVTVPSGDKTLVLTPLSFLGSPTSGTNYTIKFTDQVKKLDNSSMFKTCGVDYFEWKFEVNTSLDLVPPLVVPGGIFPIPDNIKDIYREITPAQAATAVITVEDCPKIFSAASVQSISPSGPVVVLDYSGTISKFKVSVPADFPDKAQLFNGQNNSLLGVADFDANGKVTFENYFSLQTSNHPAGSSWEIVIKPEQLADTLTAGSMVYVFATSSENNKIAVPAVCNENVQASNIQAKINGSEIEATILNNRISLTAKVAGENGNDLPLETSNPSALTLSPFSGGVDLKETNEARDRKDRPMNSVIQINFNEAINPVTVSGTSAEVANYIRVVNAVATSSPAETACDANEDCLSYKCASGKCVGNYLGGKFMIANGYRTVEFISNDECGVNGCGEKIYCLPANSHLAVELVTANLKPCNNDTDCASYSPFNTCSSTPLSYKTCQNPNNKNYPAANLSSLDGLVDAAINSFDGDRNTYADGPIAYYNDNYEPAANEDKKDKYKWSFYINDKIALTPPQISFISPAQGQEINDFSGPLQINFNTLMMNSTLRTGSALVMSGTSTVAHKLVNLSSATPTPLGYWVLCDNQDIAPLDGEPDITIANINHSSFLESVTYKAQVGSGVKDIYQNCYKPSQGPGCSTSAAKPSCCFGTATSSLTAEGNCQ